MLFSLTQCQLNRFFFFHFLLSVLEPELCMGGGIGRLYALCFPPTSCPSSKRSPARRWWEGRLHSIGNPEAKGKAMFTEWKTAPNHSQWELPGKWFVLFLDALHCFLSIELSKTLCYMIWISFFKNRMKVLFLSFLFIIECNLGSFCCFFFICQRCNVSALFTRITVISLF